MRILLICILLISSLTSCISKKLIEKECNVYVAMKKADRIAISNKDQIEIIQRVINESENYFYFKYSRNIPNIRGGSSEIIISKENCKVVERKYYQ